MIMSDYPNANILIMGDLNARIGTKQDYIDDSSKHISCMDWYVSDNFGIPRKSMTRL